MHYILLILYIIQAYLSLNMMLNVYFSPGCDRVCRHSWISSFWTPLGKTAAIAFLIFT